MTTIDLNDTLARRQDVRPNLLARLRRALATLLAGLKKRHEERAVLDELSRLDEHMLRDVGIEPMDVYDALHRKRGYSLLFNPVRPEAGRW